MFPQHLLILPYAVRLRSICLRKSSTTGRYDIALVKHVHRGLRGCPLGVGDHAIQSTSHHQTPCLHTFRLFEPFAFIYAPKTACTLGCFTAVVPQIVGKQELVSLDVMGPGRDIKEHNACCRRPGPTRSRGIDIASVAGSQHAWHCHDEIYPGWPSHTPTHRAARAHVVSSLKGSLHRICPLMLEVAEDDAALIVVRPVRKAKPNQWLTTYLLISGLTPLEAKVPPLHRSDKILLTITVHSQVSSN